jgi:hypothetical protein
MKRPLSSVVMMLVLAAGARSQEISRSENYVRATGHFSRIEVSASVTCYRQAHFCLEARSWVDPSHKVKLTVNEYQIVRWDKDGVGAHIDGHGVLNSSDLLLTFADGSVTEIDHDKAFGDLTYELQAGYAEDDSGKGETKHK